MQTFELYALIVFLLSYVGSALRAIVMPEQFRDSELEFYKSGKPGIFEIANFALTGAAFVLLVVHLVTETPHLYQILLYGMIILFDMMIPFHFMKFFRDRMVGTLKQKTAEQYRSSGLKRLGIAAVIVLLPLIYG